MNPAQVGKAFVKAPSRLHFGLLNESGTFGRVDGGVGCSIRSPSWRMMVFLADRPALIHGPCIDGETQMAAKNLVEKISQLGHRTIAVQILEAVPPHAGLGAKTALLMAIGRGAQALNAIPDIDPTALGFFIGRGGTSGIGIHASSNGGLVADAGRRFPSAKSEFTPSSRTSAYPPIKVMRIPISKELKVVHFRFANAGPNGETEASVFSQACPVSASETREIISIAYGQVIPSLVDFDEAQWNLGLAALQGLGLKQYEWQCQAPVTLQFREHFATAVPNTALCLSSMGPTMFALTTQVRPVIDAVQSFDKVPIHCTVTEVSNTGTTFETREEDQ